MRYSEGGCCVSSVHEYVALQVIGQQGNLSDVGAAESVVNKETPAQSRGRLLLLDPIIVQRDYGTTPIGWLTGA
jgi:hypothetical protein